MIEFDELGEFRRDLKKLVKKYRSLPEDFVTIKRILLLEPNAEPPFSFRIEGLKVKSCVIKVRKIACKSLKNRGVNSGLRLIYAYFEEDARIVFIEIYHKNEKTIEDRERIVRYFK